MPTNVGRQRKKPTLYMRTYKPALTRQTDEEPVADIHIPTGIYRCTTLDVGNFARISKGQESARINALLLCLQAACGSDEQLTACKRKITT